VILSREDELIQSGLILTDDTVIDPILDFNLYSNAIVNIIKNSHPNLVSEYLVIGGLERQL
jgi:hypothetical protein